MKFDLNRLHGKYRLVLWVLILAFIWQLFEFLFAVSSFQSLIGKQGSKFNSTVSSLYGISRRMRPVTPEQEAKSWNILDRLMGIQRLKKAAPPDFWKNYCNGLEIFIHPAGIFNLIAGTFLFLVFGRAGRTIPGLLRMRIKDAIALFYMVPIAIMTVIYDFSEVFDPFLIPGLVTLAAVFIIFCIKTDKTLTFPAETCLWSLLVGAWMSFPVTPYNSASLAYLCAGVSLPVCFLVLLWGMVLSNTVCRSHWAGASRDARAFLCPSCMARFVPQFDIPWLVRESGRSLAKEIPYLHNDFRDYFVCRRCGSNTRLENIHTAVAVIDRPWNSPNRQDGNTLFVNVVTGGTGEIRKVDPDELVIHNVPDLDYDTLLSNFYKSLKEDRKGLKTPIRTIPVTLVDDPPLSGKTRSRLSRWFLEVRAAGEDKSP